MSERGSLLCKVLELVAVGRGGEGFRTVGLTVVELHKRDDKNICVERGGFRLFKRSSRLE